MKKILLITGIFSTYLLSENFIINPLKIPLIEKAWSFNTTGPGGHAYYELTINGKRYPGARAWDLRWNLIKDATCYENKRILELGCNMALVSTFLMKYGHATCATGVEGPNNFLVQQGSPYRVVAAQCVAQAFEVPVHFIQVDLNEGSSNYENIIGNEYDIVFCLSLMHWIQDKKRLITFLSQFDEVIYEGHDSLEVELQRLQPYGFKNYTVLGYAGRGPLIHFYKDKN